MKYTALPATHFHRFFRSVSLLIVCMLLLLTATNCSAKKANSGDFDEDRNRLIALILSQQLPVQHFSHEPLNDVLSLKAFDLHLRQLDPRKRFLLQADVQQLDAFASHIDNEMSSGRLILADAGMDILNDRIRQVQEWIDPLLDAGFDFNRQESLELEPKKLSFAKDAAELRERWRLSLKMQILDTYFASFDEKGKKKIVSLQEIAPERHPKEMQDAIKKVREQTKRALTRLLQQTRQDHADRYFDAFARAFDPHTDYLAPSSKEDFDIQMSGSLEGIGALLREDEGMIKVIRIIPGSAAAKQGLLQAEDTILTVAEKGGEPVDVSEMRIREAVRLIRGPKGTEVRLNVQKPDGSKRLISITRDVVQIEETYVKSTVLKTNKGKLVGYIRIPSFYRDFSDQGGEKGSRNVTDDTLAELKALKQKNISGLVLDLRNNGGGALTDAVQVSGLFLKGGPVVQVKDANGDIRILDAEDPNVGYDGPLIVLVNQFSASASEILAAALQDYGRAFIIGGEHTHGKGTVQTIMDINRALPLLHLRRYDDLGALKLTIQKFYRINGGSTQFKGVEPDLVAPSIFDNLKSGEKYMDYPLPWDQVEAVPYSTWKATHFDVVKTRTLGKKWVEQSSLFQRISRESEKTKLRAEQTKSEISFEAMWNERKELAAARQEAEAAGLVNEDEDEGVRLPKEKKLEDQLAKDPFALLSLYLMETAP